MVLPQLALQLVNPFSLVETSARIFLCFGIIVSCSSPGLLWRTMQKKIKQTTILAFVLQRSTPEKRGGGEAHDGIIRLAFNSLCRWSGHMYLLFITTENQEAWEVGK